MFIRRKSENLENEFGNSENKLSIKEVAKKLEHISDKSDWVVMSHNEDGSLRIITSNEDFTVPRNSKQIVRDNGKNLYLSQSIDSIQSLFKEHDVPVEIQDEFFNKLVNYLSGTTKGYIFKYFIENRFNDNVQQVLFEEFPIFEKYFIYKFEYYICF